jgi:hypothetical protein
MRKTLLALAVLGTACGSSPVWAILQETTVTIVENGKPIPSATVTLTPVEKPDPPRLKTAKTDDKGKIILEHEDDAKKSRGPVEISIATDDGKSFTRRINLIDLLNDAPIDVSIGDCTYLDKLTDAQLKTLLHNPETRSRVAKLMEETVPDRSARKAIDKQKQDSGNSRKQKKTSKRTRNSNADETRRQPQSGMSPETASAIGTAVSIGIGFGGGRMGGTRHGGEMGHGGGTRNDRGMRQDSGMRRDSGGMPGR